MGVLFFHYIDPQNYLSGAFLQTVPQTHVPCASLLLTHESFSDTFWVTDKWLGQVGSVGGTVIHKPQDWWLNSQFLQATSF